MLYTADRLGVTRPVSMQPYYNLLYREEEREMLPLCQAEGIAVIGVDAEDLDAARLDGSGHRADDPLALVLPLVAAGRRKGDHRRPVVAVDDNAHLAAEPM